MECLICEGRTEEYEDNKLNIKTYKCSKCQYIFKDPKSFWNLDEQKDRYDLHQNNPDDLGYQKYFQTFIDFVEPKRDKIRNVLDFGSGESTLLADMLSKMSFETISFDPIYHPSTKYQKQKYDLITSVEVFEHLHDPYEVFTHLISLLDSDGVLAIRTEFAPRTMEEYFKWYYRLDPTHIGFFSSKSIEYLARSHGCKYIKDNAKNMVLISMDTKYYNISV